MHLSDGDKYLARCPGSVGVLKRHRARRRQGRFVHISAVEKAGLSTLNEGQQVQYEEVSNRGKTSAENLKGEVKRTRLGVVDAEDALIAALKVKMKRLARLPGIPHPSLDLR